ncbi:Core-2/I-Branching enzyme [Pedobacter westerhofensis]|uniref:Peptide O-xylosyltransferase n=2 Tax=Pedobacter westerhofensis TaxID=425512 RepID=A0A521FJV6_9SPHI|nr:Core-2/I-Branching enzyme [Pedobacter westerhofensis]
MKKAYIILAHKNLDHLLRMVERLDDGNSHFFIHVDLKTELPCSYAELAKNRRVLLTKRIATSWGGFSLAQATLNAMYDIKATGIHFEAINLLSGQDYPIKSNEEIDNFFKTSKYGVYLDHFTLPNYKRWDTGGTYRYQKYFFGIGKTSLLFSKLMNLLSTYVPVFARKLPAHLTPYCGSQWWTINMYALNYILSFIGEHPDYVEFHKFTFAPDELFFHIILLNAKDPALQLSISKDNLRYIKWAKLDNAHPEVLKPEDMEDLRQSGSLFARKFDGENDEKILDLIDEQILFRSNVQR